MGYIQENSVMDDMEEKRETESEIGGKILEKQYQN